MSIKRKYSECIAWLIPKGYVEIFSNHPISEIREVHFIKDAIRIKCYFNDNIVFYCQLQSSISYKPILHIISQRFEIGDEEVFEVHRRILEYVEKLTSKDEKNGQET
jgi:hypothetical protein